MFTVITLGRRSRAKIEVKSSTARIFQEGLSGSVAIFSMYIYPLKECFLNIWFIRTKIYVLFSSRSLVNIIEYEYDPKFFFFFNFHIVHYINIYSCILWRTTKWNNKSTAENYETIQLLKEDKSNLLTEKEIKTLF
jgi:hypothetical protein